MDYEKEIEQIKQRLALWEKTTYALSRAVMICSIATLLTVLTNLIEGLLR